MNIGMFVFYWIIFFTECMCACIYDTHTHTHTLNPTSTHYFNIHTGI